MKRIASDVALSTVLGLMFGFTRIIIEDRTSHDRYIDNAPDTKRWDGLVKDVWKADDTVRYKWLRSKVREIRPLPGGVMLFVLCTEWEEY